MKHRIELAVKRVNDLADEAWQEHTPDAMDEWLEVWDQLQIALEALENAYYTVKDIS